MLMRNGSSAEMKCVIVSAGEIADSDGIRRYIDGEDYVVAADGGYRYLRQWDIRCDYFIGDLDSYGGVPECEWEEFPVRKDDTDTMLAVKHGLLKGFDRFVILGALGGRLDHTIANLSVLEYLKAHGADGMLASDTTVVRLVGQGECHGSESSLHPLMEGGYLSLFPFGCESALVSVSGVQYPLHRQRLRSDFPLGVSNRVTDSEAFSLCVHEGKLLVVECREA